MKFYYNPFEPNRFTRAKFVLEIQDHVHGVVSKQCSRDKKHVQLNVSLNLHYGLRFSDICEILAVLEEDYGTPPIPKEDASLTEDYKYGRIVVPIHEFLPINTSASINEYASIDEIAEQVCLLLNLDW